MTTNFKLNVTHIMPGTHIEVTPIDAVTGAPYSGVYVKKITEKGAIEIDFMIHDGMSLIISEVKNEPVDPTT